MIYCQDCEIWWDQDDIEDDWTDEDGTAWCPCGWELREIDPEYPVGGYDTLEEKYL